MTDVVIVDAILYTSGVSQLRSLHGTLEQPISS